MKAVRVAAATLATFGLLPEVLAAAVIAHVVGFSLMGSWIFHAVRTSRGGAQWLSRRPSESSSFPFLQHMRCQLRAREYATSG